MRSNALASNALRRGNRGAAKSFAKAGLKRAEADGLTAHTFYGELLTRMAEVANARGRMARSLDYAERADAVFTRADDGIVSADSYRVKILMGIGYEDGDDFVPALMNYQAVMEDLEAQLPQDHPCTMMALGRWIHMRGVLEEAGRLKEAEAAGLCACFPYDQKRNTSLKPLQRVPPKMPSSALQSGYAILEFDVDDGRTPTNIKVLTSWPGDIYDKPSIRALKKWEYTPRAPGETDADRQGLVDTIRYVLVDQSGRMIE